MLEFGYKPVTFEYGIEWSKENGWNKINKPLIFEPFKNFGSEMDDQGCLAFTVSPFIELRLGLVIYEIVDVHVLPIISLVSGLHFIFFSKRNIFLFYIYYCYYSKAFNIPLPVIPLQYAVMIQ